MGSREYELKDLYALVNYFWQTLKKYDYRNITDEQWEEVIGNFNKMYESLLPKDAPMAELFKVVMFGVFDYLNPRARDNRKREAGQL